MRRSLIIPPRGGSVDGQGRTAFSARRCLDGGRRPRYDVAARIDAQQRGFPGDSVRYQTALYGFKRKRFIQERKILRLADGGNDDVRRKVMFGALHLDRAASARGIRSPSSIRKQREHDARAPSAESPCWRAHSRQCLPPGSGRPSLGGGMGIPAMPRRRRFRPPPAETERSPCASMCCIAAGDHPSIFPVKSISWDCSTRPRNSTPVKTQSVQVSSPGQPSAQPFWEPTPRKTAEYPSALRLSGVTSFPNSTPQRIFAPRDSISPTSRSRNITGRRVRDDRPEQAAAFDGAQQRDLWPLSSK